MAPHSMATVVVMALLSGLAAADVAKKVVSMEFTRRQTVSDTIGATLQNVMQTAYAVNISIGTPPQYMIVEADTGSSDLVILGPNSCLDANALCNPNNPALAGITPTPLPFYSNVSSSIQDMTDSLGGFTATYGGGNTDLGSYLADTVSINGAVISNQTFGYVQQANNPQGALIIPIMGLGFATDESVVTSESSSTPYPSVLQQMKSQGLIDVAAYSIWLNDPAATGGTILFGGIDTAKFSGNLAAVPIVPDPETGLQNRLLVPWTSLTYDSSDGTSATLYTGNYGALLDSGTTQMVLPTSLAMSLANGLGLSPQPDGSLLVDCLYSQLGDTFTFGFNNDPTATISVPVSNFLKPLLLAGGTPQVDQAGNALCSVGVVPDATGFAILGDIFMNAGYFLFDLDNNIISMAQAVLNTTASNVLAIAGTTGVGATTVATTATIAILPSSGVSTLPVSPKVTATAKTLSIPSASPTLNLGSAKAGPSNTGTATSASASASKSSAASPMRQAPAQDDMVILAGIISLMTVLGGSFMLAT